jgi:predicted kinase
MTAKEKLRERVEKLSEAEAADTLDYLASRQPGQRDALTVLLENAPLDDEPTTPEEEAAVQIAREELARGETVSLDEIRREFA